MPVQVGQGLRLQRGAVLKTDGSPENVGMQIALLNILETQYARSELNWGSRFEFGPITIYPRREINALKPPGHNCAVGRIRYSVMDGSTVADGILIYIKV